MTINSLSWVRDTKYADIEIAKIDCASRLRISGASGSYTLMLLVDTTLGTVREIVCSGFSDADEAKTYARTWIGDDDAA